MLTTHSNQYANRPCCCPTIDASLGVGMVGGVKALVLLLVVVCVGCGTPPTKNDLIGTWRAKSKRTGLGKVIKPLNLTLDENNKFTIAEEEDEFFDIPPHLQAVLPAPKNELLWQGRWKIEGGEVRLDYDKTNLVEWLKVRTYSAHGERYVAGLELMYDNIKGSAPHKYGFDRALIGAVVGAVIGNNVGPRPGTTISGMRNFPGAVTGAAIASGDPPSPPSEQIRVYNGAFYTPTVSQDSIVDIGHQAKKLQQLTSLNLDFTRITDAYLKEVAKLQQLTSLSLQYTQITDTGLKEVSKLQKLERLDLTNTKVTKAGVAELQKALPKCKIKSNPTK